MQAVVVCSVTECSRLCSDPLVAGVMWIIAGFTATLVLRTPIRLDLAYYH